jgi:hypothetical protein
MSGVTLPALAPWSSTASGNSAGACLSRAPGTLPPYRSRAASPSDVTRVSVTPRSRSGVFLRSARSAHTCAKGPLITTLFSIASTQPPAASGFCLLDNCVAASRVRMYGAPCLSAVICELESRPADASRAAPRATPRACQRSVGSRRICTPACRPQYVPRTTRCASHGSGSGSPPKATSAPRRRPPDRWRQMACEPGP